MPREVTIEEIFTWGEDFGRNAKEAFGGHYCDCSSQTFSDLKERCVREEIARWPYFNAPLVTLPTPWNGVQIHVAKEVRDGVLVACSCRKEPSR